MSCTVVPVPLENKPKKKDMLGFEYAEHSYIGDAIQLTLTNGQKIPAIDHGFTLENGLVVTYGQINGLAGDFYGTTHPISDGMDAQDRSARFLAAYQTLVGPSSRQPGEAESILAILKTKLDAVNDALRRHENPSIAYSKFPDVTHKLEALTITRPDDTPSYMVLTSINWDHFGADARTSYNAGHTLALYAASTGNLEGAYTLNAFADHFLEDSFSSGHLRTPRRGLHSKLDVTPDLCAKLMHDEDCAIGLSVRNPGGESWECYGDKRALDVVNADNLKRCLAAVQASADEVYAAYTSGRALAPLFKYNNRDRKQIDRRSDIRKHTLHEFTQSWWFWSTAAECEISGLWNYPIHLASLEVVPRTDITAIVPRPWSIGVYYQSPSGGILQSTHVDGNWTGGVGSHFLWDTLPFSPLASVTWDDGRFARVYSLNRDHKLQEYCLNDGEWVVGGLNELNIVVLPNTSIAALLAYFGGGNHIRVYCQEAGSKYIKEFCHDGDHWRRGETLPSALSGTSIAATVVDAGNLRVYYQAEDLTIREYAHGSNGWYHGRFSGGKAPGHTHIDALLMNGRLAVFWVDADSHIVCRIVEEGDGLVRKVVGSVLAGSKFAAVKWNDGRNIRVYYHAVDNSIREICNDDGGSWLPGPTLSPAS